MLYPNCTRNHAITYTKKNLWFRFPTDPIFFCRPYYFFNAIERATLFSPGGCGLLSTACQNGDCCHTIYSGLTQAIKGRTTMNTLVSPIHRFHLEGNFLPEGNLGLWKEIWKEMSFGRKLGGNIVIRREMRRKFYFIS